jgi:hypothetical protein
MEKQAAQTMSANQAMKFAKMENEATKKPSGNVNVSPVTINQSSPSIMPGNEYWRGIQPEIMRRNS